MSKIAQNLKQLVFGFLFEAGMGFLFNDNAPHI